MPYSTRILADSITTHGNRLTTWEVTYPRMVHADFMSHRMFSRSSSSSRAAPIQKTLRAVWYDPAMPVWWGVNQSGMQARSQLTGWRLAAARRIWLAGRVLAIAVAWSLWRVGLHKQLANRVLEPWAWITVIASATEVSNFFGLRLHPDAQPELQRAAMMMWESREASEPRLLAAGEWHLPLTDDVEELRANYSEEAICKIAIGRCARVSYLTHDGRRDPAADVALTDGKLLPSGHMGPFEHVATPAGAGERVGNFVGWRQYRAGLRNEADFAARGAEET